MSPFVSGNPAAKAEGNTNGSAQWVAWNNTEGYICVVRVLGEEIQASSNAVVRCLMR